MPDVEVAIVGAGAAGLATALFIREQNPGCSVALVDGAARPGAKILISGGGRCNVTNRVVSERDFWGGPPTIVRRVLRAMPVKDTVAFFQRIGVPLHEEANGKLFPDSNRARDVLDALLTEARRAGVDFRFGQRVTEIHAQRDQFTISTDRGTVSARRTVLATGGRSIPKSGSDGAGYEMATRLGHTIVPTVPALVPLMLDATTGASHARLSGVTHPGELTVWIDERVLVRLTGSLLWTHFGVSGPLALDASRHWTRATDEGRSVRITLNLCAPARFDEMDRRIQTLVNERPRASLLTVVSGLVMGSVAEVALEQSGVDTRVSGAHLSKEQRRALARQLVEWPLAVVGTRGYNYAEVTAGGVDLSEIDPATLESRRCRGLYLVGEILDVDGRIGGFNFQWAWSSARVAARAISLQTLS